jgi:hypothetical protein
MKIPAIQGLIERRILINYSVDEQTLRNFLPEPFEPKLVNGRGVAGICLIRLKEIRPPGLPKQIGISSENGAHRIAVTWKEHGSTKEGVYIPRRDTNSYLNAFAGGRVFPGVHHLAKFNFHESNGNYQVAFDAKDGTSLSIKAEEAESWNPKSIFEDLTSASKFFENGTIGFSPIPKTSQFQGLELKVEHWKVSTLKVSAVHSSFFEDEQIFPKGTLKFDNALLMRNISHTWNGLEKLSCP